jgi:hypothetical protein
VLKAKAKFCDNSTHNHKDPRKAKFDHRLSESRYLVNLAVVSLNSQKIIEVFVFEPGSRYGTAAEVHISHVIVEARHFFYHKQFFSAFQERLFLLSLCLFGEISIFNITSQRGVLAVGEHESHR